MTVSEYLEKIIDDYTLSGEFDDYLKRHAEDVVKYLRPDNTIRTVMFRASSAGTCWQEQCFRATGEPESDVITRPAKQIRALHNGTFLHARYHLYFDALEEKGLLRTIAAETLREDKEFELSGTIDRVIAFDRGGVTKVFVVDFKSIKSAQFRKLAGEGPKPEHAKQQMKYHILKWNADGWCMLYEDKDSHDIRIYTKPYDTELIEQIKKEHKRAMEWVELRKTGANYPFPPDMLSRTWCNYCPYRAKCKALNGVK